MTSIRYQEALVRAVRDEMERDESVLYIGEDVVHSLRGVSNGLSDRFGDQRVLDTPISEQAFTGFATGAALAGYRPIVEFQIPSLTYLAFEQIANQAQKARLMSGGQAAVPVTYLVPGSGARRGLSGQHSDHPYSLFVHVGVKTVVPATAADAYGLLVAAIRDPDPVIVFAPAAALARRDDVPDEPYLVPLGTGCIRRSGNDVTLVAIGHLVHEALELAERLADSVSIEVFDPRTLLPFDWELLEQSVSRTGRLVIADDASRSCGMAAEIAATVAETMGNDIRIRRVTRADVTVPFAVALEEAVLPRSATIEAALDAVLTR